jgi:hypothetical protein
VGGAVHQRITPDATPPLRAGPLHKEVAGPRFAARGSFHFGRMLHCVLQIVVDTHCRIFSSCSDRRVPKDRNRMTAIEQKQIAAGSGACRGTDRTRRFLARIDAHLRSLAGDRERRAFLERQLEGWECRYARFIATQGASEFSASTRDPPHAAIRTLVRVRGAPPAAFSRFKRPLTPTLSRSPRFREAHGAREQTERTA